MLSINHTCGQLLLISSLVQQLDAIVLHTILRARSISRVASLLTLLLAHHGVTSAHDGVLIRQIFLATVRLLLLSAIIAGDVF